MFPAGTMLTPGLPAEIIGKAMRSALGGRGNRPAAHAGGESGAAGGATPGKARAHTPRRRRF